MIQFDLQCVVAVGAVVAVIAKAITRAAGDGGGHAILIGVRGRERVVIRRTLVKAQPKVSGRNPTTVGWFGL